MISPVLIVTKRNEAMFKKACAIAKTAPPRIIAGENFSFGVYVKRDIRSHGSCTHFLLDASAFKEQGEDFISCLRQMECVKNPIAKPIIYADRFYAGDDFLWELYRAGYTEIVANCDTVDKRKNAEMMFEDLQECLSENGLTERKKRRYDRNFANRGLAEKAEKNAEAETEKNYSKSRFKIAVCGSMERIGTTTSAVQICDYITRRGGRTALVFADDNAKIAEFEDGFEHRQIEQLKEDYGGEIVDNRIAVKNIDIYTASGEVDFERYNAVVFDCGNLSATPENADYYCKNSDFVILCGGAKLTELIPTALIQKKLCGINYVLAVNFSTPQDCEKHAEYLSLNENPYIAMPFAPRFFGETANEKIFDGWFGKFQEN